MGAAVIVDEDLISTRLAAIEAGLSYRQIDYWCRVGIVEPTVEPHGSGTRRLWAYRDIPALRFAAAVGRALGGGDLSAVGRAWREVREWPDLLERGRLFIAPDGRVGSLRLPDGVDVGLVIERAAWA